MRCDFAIAPQITYEEKICMKNQKTKISLLLLLVLMLALFAGFGTAAEGNEVEDAKASVLTYEGMLARTTGDSGIRSMFRIDRAALKTLEENGDGFIKAMWCGEEECEDKVKETTGVGSRCIPFDGEQLADTCVCCGKPAKHMVLWGKAY